MSASRLLKVLPRSRSSGLVEPAIRRDATGLALYAVCNYAPRQVILQFKDVVWSIDRNQLSVEHPCGAHVYHPLLARAAHSCAPNAELDFRLWAMIAARLIAAGERVAFDYALTERWISHPFACLCGAPACRGRVE